LLLDNLIMRGGYGPTGPSRSQARPAAVARSRSLALQIDALRMEQERAEHNIPGAGFGTVLDALNILGRTKWCATRTVG